MTPEAINRHGGLGIIAMLALGGCNSTEQVKLDAGLAKAHCLELAAESLGIKTAGLEDGDVKMANDLDKALRFVSTGQFVVTFDKLQFKGLDHRVSVTCTGDFNRRTITSLQLDGVIKRPAKPEDWAFQ